MSAYIAAYFAARNAAVKAARMPHLQSGELAVVALRRLTFDYVANPFEPAIVEVEAPYAENPNLRAQQGTFSLVTYKSARKADDFVTPSIESVLHGWVTWKHHDVEAEMENFPFLVKFTLPATQAGRLLRLLRSARVWAPTVHPNYDGVVEGIAEPALYT